MINRNDSNAVWLTHKPTGIEVKANGNRHQHRNRTNAFELLRARLWADANVERKDALVRSYDLPDGVYDIDYAVLGLSGSTA